MLAILAAIIALSSRSSAAFRRIPKNIVARGEGLGNSGADALVMAAMQLRLSAAALWQCPSV
jgi:hypothetical protein